MRMEEVPKPKNDTAERASGRGDVPGRVYGEMHAGSFIRDGKRVDIRRTPSAGYRDPVRIDERSQEWSGRVYRLRTKEKYLSCGPNGGERLLHRAVWAGAFGPIPEGCHIHHRDGDKLNNGLANLECIPASQHLSEAWHALRGNLSKEQHFGDKARRAAAEWHASPEGSAWHSEHAIESKGWLKWKRERRKCLQCGCEFDALIRKGVVVQVYCQPKCKAAAYRQQNRQNKWAADYRARQKVKRDSGRMGSDSAGSG